MEKKKILYISNEIKPFVGESEMSSSCRTMLLNMQDAGHELRAFMPKWGPINERRNQLHEVIRLSGMNIIIDDTDHPLIIKVASMPSARLQVYFIDNDDYFQNRLIEADKNGVEYQDNDERTIFFARGVLETVKKLRWNPDIIHCHGWLASLIPTYIKTAYKEEPAFRDSKVVMSVYGNELKEPFRDSYQEFIITKDMQPGDAGQFASPFTFSEVMKKAIDFSDGVVISPDESVKELKEYALGAGKTLIDGDEAKNSESIEKFYTSLF
ncbi:MAG: glycogen/starch synthase [Bacteroidaceae bacterium]|nr:glycogen/starch synthase [Bacteroidaceae bacterium]